MPFSDDPGYRKTVGGSERKQSKHSHTKASASNLLMMTMTRITPSTLIGGKS